MMELRNILVTHKETFIRGNIDQVLLQDRVIDNLLDAEQKYFTPKQQTWISHDTRKLVTEWMLEICQELPHNSNQVFITSVNYLDTIISSINIKPSQLQLLASSCLSVASKLLNPKPFSLRDFVRVPDSNMTVEQLQEMELLILTALRYVVDILNQSINKSI